MRGRPILLILLLLAVAALVYAASYHLQFYADDFQYVFIEPSRFIFHDFLNPNPINTFYRPLQTLVLASIQTLWGWETLPIRIVHLLLHTTIAVLIFRALRFWNIDGRIAFFGACYFVLAQMNGAAVLGNDTVSQLLATLFLVLTLWQFYQFKLRGIHSKYILSIVLYFLAIVSKETSSGLIVALGFLSFVMRPPPRRVGHVIRELAPFAVCAVLYWVMRTTAGAEVPVFGTEEQYRFSFQVNVPINLGLLIIQSFVPVSSLSIAEWVHERNYAVLSGVALISFLVAAVILNGLLRSPHRRIILSLGVLVVLSWIPVLFLSRVSEQYVYNSAPFVAALFAFAIEYYWSSRRAIPLIVPLLVVVCALNIHGIVGKTLVMKEQGERAMRLLEQIPPFLRSAPPKAYVYLVQPKEDRFFYSLYRLQGFTVISWSQHLLRQAANRPDLEIYIWEEHEYRQSAVRPNIALTFDPATVKVYPFENPDSTRLPAVR